MPQPMTTSPKSEFLREAKARGFIHQITDEAALDAKLTSGTPQLAYIGFDATADSLHAGSLVQIMLLRLFQRTGHRPVVLMGGGTTKIGDPSGKDDVRKMLSDADIAANIRGIRSIFDKYIDFGPGKALSVDNAEWLDGLKYIPLLREVGKHFSVNRMLTMDSVKLRLERDQPLSFLEFNYMVLQSYDFVELSKRHACIAQMGGSDQWWQHRDGCGSRPPAGECRAVRRDHAAARHIVGCQDGQDGRWRGVAQCRAPQPVRLFPVLAEHRGRRCRALPQAVHRPVARRDRQAREARRGRDQRGQEGSRLRSDEAVPRNRSRRPCRRHSAQDVRAGVSPPKACRPSRFRPAISHAASPFSIFSCLRGLAASKGEARRLV